MLTVKLSGLHVVLCSDLVQWGKTECSNLFFLNLQQYFLRIKMEQQKPHPPVFLGMRPQAFLTCDLANLLFFEHSQPVSPE